MTGLRKWLDNRVSEYLAIEEVDLTSEQYEELMDAVDLWLFENINDIISEKLKEM